MRLQKIRSIGQLLLSYMVNHANCYSSLLVERLVDNRHHCFVGNQPAHIFHGLISSVRAKPFDLRLSSCTHLNFDKFNLM
jgi:hypothetical protein